MTAPTPGCGSNSEARKRSGEMWSIQRANPDVPVEVGEEVTITPIMLGDIRASERATDAPTVVEVPAGHCYHLIDGLDGQWLCETTDEYPEPSPIGLLDSILAASEQARIDATRAEVKAEALREAADYFRTDAAKAWGGDRSWLTTGTKVANLAGDWLDGIADDLRDAKPGGAS